MQSENNTELKEKVVAINRVAKVVKGGSAVVVVGDENGHVGVGNGKAAEVPDAIKKAIQDAKKNLVEVPIVGTTVPHEYVGKFGSANVMLKPAEEGTGVIAGGSVRPILELAGYKDIRTKVIGTNNPRNVVYATLAGLKSMRTAEQIAKKRGKTVHCSDYRIHSSSRNLVGRGVHIPVWRTGGVDAYTFCPWIHKGGNCIFYMLFCVPLIRKWTQAETDPKVGRQRLENDSICGRNVNAV